MPTGKSGGWESLRKKGFLGWGESVFVSGEKCLSLCSHSVA